MPNFLEMMGMGPKREENINSNGTVTITVTPPKSIFPKAKGQSVTLSPLEYRAYCDWREGKGMIQDLLPNLTLSQREALMSGLSDDEFAKAAAPLDSEFYEPCPDCHGTGGLYASHGGQVIDRPCHTCNGTGRV